MSISYAELRDGVVEVNGFVAGVLEDGGTCTATVTSGGQTVSASGAAFADATVTWCDPITVDAPNAKVGDEVTLEYRSATTSGRATAPIGAP